MGGGQLAEGGVPVGLEGVGDEPVGGVDGQVAAAGLVGGVVGALHVGGADAVGVGGAGGELVGDGQCDLRCQWVRVSRIRAATAVSMPAPGRDWQMGTALLMPSAWQR